MHDVIVRLQRGCFNCSRRQNTSTVHLKIKDRKGEGNILQVIYNTCNKLNAFNSPNLNWVNTT